MNSMLLSCSGIKDIFEELHHKFGGNLNSNIKEHVLNLDNETGKGRISGITFTGGISYFDFDITFSENFVVEVETLENTPICFGYCSKGKLAHSFGHNSNMDCFENFQTTILTNAPYVNNLLYFSKDTPTKISLIVVKTANNVKQSTLRNDLRFKIQELFFNGLPSKNSIYKGSHNLKIANKIQQIDSIEQEGIVRSLLIEGLIHVTLALEIQQYSDDLLNTKGKSGSLTETEMDLVLEVSKFIENYPERSLSLRELTRKSGLSPSKLQEGFKLLHGTTVSDYIRDVRLIKAEKLIKKTNLNISEVVYSIGFTSRSYFSKIFKLKYNCSPKQYQDKQKNTMMLS
ncbi:helix-turn-helix domain-containing protein [Maribacter sp. X9]|uniref:helix-turn-helix domain-containing protein n=1 Tax=Maribacter sp. X9 TaxID=3402159 RepID=UPI003AF34469